VDQSATYSKHAFYSVYLMVHHIG